MVECSFDRQINCGLGAQEIPVGGRIAQAPRGIDFVDASMAIEGAGSERLARTISCYHDPAKSLRALASCADTLALLTGLRTTGTILRCSGIVTLSPYPVAKTNGTSIAAR